MVYLKPVDHGTELRRRDLASGLDATVSLIEQPMAIGRSASPGGRYALYSKVDQQESDLMPVENFR